MATVTKYYCDCCNREVDHSEDLKIARFAIFLDSNPYSSPHTQSKQICHFCIKELGFSLEKGNHYNNINNSRENFLQIVKKLFGRKSIEND